MIRGLAVAAALAAVTWGFAPAALADDESGRYPTDVPGMNYQAALGAPCENTQLFTFGRGRGGQPMKCSWIPNQWPPVHTGFWTVSYDLHGVQEVGAPCSVAKGAAQTPDGRPMLCLGARGWQPGVLTGDGFFPA